MLSQVLMINRRCAWNLLVFNIRDLVDDDDVYKDVIRTVDIFLMKLGRCDRMSR